MLLRSGHETSLRQTWMPDVWLAFLMNLFIQISRCERRLLQHLLISVPPEEFSTPSTGLSRTMKGCGTSHPRIVEKPPICPWVEWPVAPGRQQQVKELMAEVKWNVSFTMLWALLRQQELSMCRREGRGKPMIFSAVLTTLCNLFFSATVQLEYHTVMA